MQKVYNKKGRRSGKKCIRKIDETTGEIEYQRVKTKVAEDLVWNHGWSFCSKDEWRKANGKENENLIEEIIPEI